MFSLPLPAARYYIIAVYNDDYPYHVHAYAKNRFVGAFRTEGEAKRYVECVSQLTGCLSIPVASRPKLV